MIDDSANNSKKFGYKNLSSSDKPTENKIAKTTQNSVFSTTNRYSCLAVDENPEKAKHSSQNPSNVASDDISEPAKPGDRGT